MEILNSFLSETWSLYNEMAIYLLFGFFVAGILHVFFPQKFVAKHLGKSSVGSVLKSSAFGVPLPLCSCGVIPVAASMRKKGASRGAAISFLISTPQIGADSFMITYSLIGWVFAVFRIGAAFITAVAAGLITNFTGKKERENDKESGNNIVVPDSETVSDRLKVIHRYIQYDLFASIARYLLIGILLGGLISAAVPDGFFKGFLGNQFLSMLIMLAVATPLYVCATASTPIAASLLMKGISPGAALVFLLAGPATNTVTITTVAKSLGKRTAIIYLLSIASVSVGLGFILNGLFYGSELKILHVHEHEMLPGWFTAAGAALLGIMFLIHYYSVVRIRMRNKKSENKKEENKMKDINTLKVKGMTCNHCANSVSKAVKAAGGEDPEVNLEAGTVSYGGSPDTEKVRKLISDEGYEPGELL